MVYNETQANQQLGHIVRDKQYCIFSKKKTNFQPQKGERRMIQMRVAKWKSQISHKLQNRLE